MHCQYMYFYEKKTKVYREKISGYNKCKNKNVKIGIILHKLKKKKSSFILLLKDIQTLYKIFCQKK